MLVYRQYTTGNITMPWARNIVLGLTFPSITNYESILKFVIFISNFKYTFVTYEVYSLYSILPQDKSYILLFQYD